MARTLNPRNDPNAPWYHLDPLVVIAPFGLAIVGLAAIYSTTRGTDPEAYRTFYLERQLVFVVLGVGVMVAAAVIDYQKLRALAPALYALGILSLVAVLSPLGSNVNGAQAWFNVGPFGLQPSEFMKLAVIVLLASYLSRFEGHLGLGRLVIALIVAAIPMGLIAMQPDVGTLLVFVAIVMGMFLVGGAQFRHIVALTLLGVGLVAFMVNSPVLEEYQRDRLTTFINPDLDAEGAGFNQEQAQIAIGNGGLTGQGYGEGDQTRSGLVPEQETDFIFTVVGEELGFVGSSLVLGLFALLIWRVWRAAQLAKDQFGTLLCVGIATMIVFQMFESIGMTAGIMPVTGIPLPFISYGGSSSLVSFMSVGLVLNVRMRRWQ
ncbi:MAG: rod shape-determining protein RodA [Acidimicrobiia bacterium]|nr:rod shape-determining protein RodA [Acidimicrobiia bacterium]